MTLFSGPRPPNCPLAIHYDGKRVCGRACAYQVWACVKQIKELHPITEYIRTVALQLFSPLLETNEGELKKKRKEEMEASREKREHMKQGD